jgi:hypothetical protein
MLTPTDFIFNDLSDSEKPNFIECVNPPHDSNVWHDRGDKIPKSTIKYKKIIGSTVQAGEHDYSNYLNFLNSYISCQDVSSQEDIFFPGVRYLSHGLVVFERPPSYKVINVSQDGKDSIDEDTSQVEYYLPIPWQVYIAMYNPKDMRLTSVRMYFTKTSLFDKNQTVYAPPMFNFFGSGALCRPFFESIDDIEKYPRSISGVMASAYDWVWNSGFNFDITENLAEMIYTNKYEQFEQYLKTDASKVSYQFLKDHPINQIGSSLHRRHSGALLSAWEQVPLEHVSSINWTNYSIADFMFQEFDYTNMRDEFFDQYIQDNNITIAEESEYDFHCDSGCDCECNNPDCSCCDGCGCEPEDSSLTRDNLYRSSAFKRYIIDKSRNTEKTLDLAISKSIEFLRTNRVAQSPITPSSLNYYIDNLLDSHFPA